MHQPQSLYFSADFKLKSSCPCPTAVSDQLLP